MISVNGRDIDAQGNLEVLLVDAVMISAYLYGRITAELGEEAAKQFFNEELIQMITPRSRKGKKKKIPKGWKAL